MLSQVKPANPKYTFGHIQSEAHITRTICLHLTDDDLNQCALVSKVWHAIVQDARSVRTVDVTLELCETIKRKKLKLIDYILNEWPYARYIVLHGWSGSNSLPCHIYNDIFESQFKAKSVILKGRGCWDDCKCPKQKKVSPNKMIDSSSNTLANLENLHVAGTFSISSCALLDIISRSPNLKELKFYGLICKHDHCETFKQWTMLSDLEAIHWPWPSKRQMPTLMTLTHRHDGLVTFYSSSQAVCDSLAADRLRNVRFLSLCLNENWRCKPKQHKKTAKYVQKIQYLSLAKKVEGLEVRTFDPDLEGEEEEEVCQETNDQVMKIFENYKLTFWMQVAKLPNLKYLAMYGSWDFDNACREMAKHGLKVEYLKINLMPSSVLTAIDAGEDCPILSMVDGVRNLRKLPNLRSIHYICHEKLLSIEERTTTALKELIDLFWCLDIKTGISEEVEDLMNNIMRRGNQLGKIYKYLLHIQSKPDSEFANLVTEQTLKYPLGSNLREKITAIAENVASERYGRAGYENYQLWGLYQVGNMRDRNSYDRLSSDWKLFNGKFHIGMSII